MIERIIQIAGTMILKGPEEIHGKIGLANFVTNRDAQIQNYLISQISTLYSDAHFFGEEDTEKNDKQTVGHCFFIDPIDGTTNYIFGYQHSCVSIGEAIDGRLIAGWIYNPFTEQMWSARRGEGAWLNGNRITVDDRELKDGVVAFGCARYNEGDTDTLFSIVKECYLNSLSVRNGGSAAIDLARVASSANVAYIELFLQPYDYAAASIIIEEAGGVIIQTDGAPITIGRGCSILAGTPTAVKQIQTIIKKWRS